MSWGWKFWAAGVGMLEVDWVMTRGSNQYFPISEVLLRSRATSVSALFFMNVSSPSAPAMLPFQRPEQTNVYVKYPLNLGLVISRIQKSKPNIPLIQSLRCQLVPTNRRGFALRLLCMGLQGCTFAIPLCCWKNTPWKQESLGMEWFSSVLWQFFCLILV